MSWHLYIIISTIFFILSQLCLRQSFELKCSPMHTFTLFTMTIGILSLVTLSQQLIDLQYDVKYSIAAGFLFLWSSHVDSRNILKRIIGIH